MKGEVLAIAWDRSGCWVKVRFTPNPFPQGPVDVNLPVTPERARSLLIGQTVNVEVTP